MIHEIIPKKKKLNRFSSLIAEISHEIEYLITKNILICRYQYDASKMYSITYDKNIFIMRDRTFI